MEVPVHYSLSRGFKAIDKLERVFAITPILCCIVTDPHDTPFALKLNPAVIQSSADNADLLADMLGDRYGLPAVVIGEADGLEAVYADGRREKLDA